MLVMYKNEVIRMLANAQSDGRPAEHRWRALFNVAKFGWHPQLDSVGSFVISCILFGKSKNSLDFERRYDKLYKKLGCHFFFTF